MQDLTPEEKTKLDELMKQKQVNEPVNDKSTKTEREKEKVSGASMAEILVGLALFGAGFFMVTHNTVLYSGFTLANFIGFTPPFGVVLLPLLIGIGVLFYDDKSLIGWGLSAFGIMIIILGIIMGLRIVFSPVSLFEGILMFGMLFAGAGLLFRVLRRIEI